MEQLLLVVKYVAPTVASLLNGPMGDTIIKLLAGVLGSAPTAAAVTKAVVPAPGAALDPTVKGHLENLEALVTARQADDTLEAQSLNLVSEAYLKELGHGLYWSALRPTAGWLLLVFTSAYATLVVKAAWFNSFVPMDHVLAYLGALSPLAAVTGVYFWGRTSEKNSLIGAIPSGGNIPVTGATTGPKTPPAPPHK